MNEYFLGKYLTFTLIPQALFLSACLATPFGPAALSRLCHSVDKRIRPEYSWAPALWWIK